MSGAAVANLKPWEPREHLAVWGHISGASGYEPEMPLDSLEGTGEPQTQKDLTPMSTMLQLRNSGAEIHKCHPAGS